MRCSREEVAGRIRAWAGSLLAGALALLIVVAPSAPASAQAKHAAMVLDANSGQVLHAQGGDELRHPASLTKMMTLYLAFELVEQGRLSYATRIKISQEAASAAPSKLDLEPGETLTLGDAIKALITKSANDIAVAIAEHISGSEARFAQLMTERARQIGMRNTTFRNASGLPDSAQVTTARDMITLGLRLHDDFPRHYALFSTRSFTFNGSSFRNHNNLLFNYSGTEGIKTGYTRASGFNVVVSVKKEGKHVVAAVFGGGSASARDAHARAILNRALPKAATVRTRKIEPMLIARGPTAPSPRLAVRPRPTPAQPTAAKDDAKSVMAAAAPAVPVAPARPSEPAPVAAPPVMASPVMASAPASAKPAAPPSPIALAEPAPPDAAVDVARVRRVMVAPRIKQAPPSDTTEEPAEAAQTIAALQARAAGGAASPPMRSMEATRGDLFAPSARRAQLGQDDAAPHRDAPLGASETAVVKSASGAARAPSTLAAQVEALARAPTQQGPGPLPAANVPARPAATVAPALSPMQRGAAPSTLQAQASRIESGQPAIPAPPPPVRVAMAGAPTSVPPAYRLQGPDPATARNADPAQGGFHIQVGAYATTAEADRQLAAVRQRAAGALAGSTSVTLPVQKGSRQLYRARFAGFSAGSAANACLELRRLQVDCFVMKAE